MEGISSQLSCSDINHRNRVRWLTLALLMVLMVHELPDGRILERVFGGLLIIWHLADFTLVVGKLYTIMIFIAKMMASFNAVVENSVTKSLVLIIGA